jgi:hypothetical protein
MTTLVVDTGQNLVGVFSVEEQIYVPYRGAEIPIALQCIANEKTESGEKTRRD